jgi:hypothetical protein
MKIEKAKGFGSYGTVVTDMDFNDHEQWKRLREVNLASLVTVVRGNGTDQFPLVNKNMHLVGRVRRIFWVLLKKKYGDNPYSKIADWDEVDLSALKTAIRWLIHTPLPDGWNPITGKTTDQGKSLGGFTRDAECLWHTHESGCHYFHHLNVLYGAKGMLNTSTGFVQAADWYEKQSESFKSELDEMLILHKHRPYSLGKHDDPDYENQLKAFTIEGGTTLPLMIQSPGNIKGPHIASNTLDSIVGLSTEESDKLLAKIREEIYTPEYMWDPWWKNDSGDFILFDNTIVEHRRTVREGFNELDVLTNRLGYHGLYDYRNLKNYKPFFQEEYNVLRTNYTDEADIVSDQVDKRTLRKVMNSMTNSDHTEFIKRFNEEELAEILAFDMNTHIPHVDDFPKDIYSLLND